MRDPQVAGKRHFHRRDQAMFPTSDGIPHERRAVLRTVFETNATVHMVNQQFNCLTRDLSPRGLALDGQKSPVPPGTFMRLQFSLPNESLPIGIDGVLVRADPQDSGMIWGLQFIEPQARVQAKIEEYLDAQLPACPLLPEGFLSQAAPGNGLDAQYFSAEDTPAEFHGSPQEARRDDHPKPRLIPVHPHHELSQTPLRPVPKAQFIRIYEQAMINASSKRQVAGTENHQQPRGENGPSDRGSKDHEKHGVKTTLDLELQWLYDRAAGKRQGR